MMVMIMMTKSMMTIMIMIIIIIMMMMIMMMLMNNSRPYVCFLHCAGIQHDGLGFGHFGADLQQLPAR